MRFYVPEFNLISILHKAHINVFQVRVMSAMTREASLVQEMFQVLAPFMNLYKAQWICVKSVSSEGNMKVVLHISEIAGRWIQRRI